MAKSTKKRKNTTLAPYIRDLDVPKLPPLDDPNGLLLQVQTDFRGSELTLYRLFGHIAHIWLTYERDLEAYKDFRKNPFWTSAERRRKGKPKRESKPATILRFIVEFAVARSTKNISRQTISDYGQVIQFLVRLRVGVEQIPAELESRGGERKVLNEARLARRVQKGLETSDDLSDLMTPPPRKEEELDEDSTSEAIEDLINALEKQLCPVLVCKDPKRLAEESDAPPGTEARVRLKMGKKGFWLVKRFAMTALDADLGAT